MWIFKHRTSFPCAYRDRSKHRLRFAPLKYTQNKRERESVRKLKWDDGGSSRLEVLEAVLGFRPECRRDGVCLAACTADRSRWRTWNWTAILHSARLDVTHSTALCPCLSSSSLFIPGSKFGVGRWRLLRILINMHNGTSSLTSAAIARLAPLVAESFFAYTKQASLTLVLALIKIWIWSPGSAR